MVADVINIVNKNLKGEKIRGADIAEILKTAVVSVSGPIVGVVTAIIEGLLAVLSWYRNSQLHLFNGYQIGDLPYKGTEASALAADLQKAFVAVVAQRERAAQTQPAGAAFDGTLSMVSTKAATLGETARAVWAQHSKKIMAGIGVAAVLYLILSLLKSRK